MNLAARIGEFAPPGEVLVSRQVVEAAGERDGVAFRAMARSSSGGIGGR